MELRTSKESIRWDKRKNYGIVPCLEDLVYAAGFERRLVEGFRLPLQAHFSHNGPT